MGIAVTFVLTCSNVLISTLRTVIPARVRIPTYIVIIATFVTIVQLLMKAYLPDLARQLGIYVNVIAVNCLILGRVEAFASKNKTMASFLDGISMGLGFTLALSLISALREILGTNKIAGLSFIPGFKPITVFILAPGGFFTVALVMAVINHYYQKKNKAERA
jgi:electron transport complex protein RnfE